MTREIIATYVPLSAEEQEMQYRAFMTQNQFEALECKLNESVIIEQLLGLDYINNIQLSSGCNINDVEKWLKNSWNTERLLRFTYESFDGKSLSFSIQWAFPQIYYSVFSLILAYFRVVGFTERSHSAVIKKIGQLFNEGKYPSIISFIATGGIRNITFNNIEMTSGYESIHFNRNDNNTINNQICQFLKTTRELELRNKKQNIKIPLRNRKGYKENFNQEDWEQVSSRLGYSNILSLLYRKRIKSNYRDIDTFLSEHLDADILFNSIIEIIGKMNIIHEIFVAKGIGLDRYFNIVTSINYDFVSERYEKINGIIT